MSKCNDCFATGYCTDKGGPNDCNKIPPTLLDYAAGLRKAELELFDALGVVQFCKWLTSILLALTNWAIKLMEWVKNIKK